MVMVRPMPTSWRELGRCKDEDPDVFYPEDDEDPGEEAKAICAMCLVRDVPREETPGGVWTPGAAMADKLIQRLQANAGLRFALEN